MDERMSSEEGSVHGKLNMVQIIKMCTFKFTARPPTLFLHHDHQQSINLAYIYSLSVSIGVHVHVSTRRQRIRQ